VYAFTNPKMNKTIYITFFCQNVVFEQSWGLDAALYENLHITSVLAVNKNRLKNINLNEVSY